MFYAQHALLAIPFHRGIRPAHTLLLSSPRPPGCSAPDRRKTDLCTGRAVAVALIVVVVVRTGPGGGAERAAT